MIKVEIITKEVELTQVKTNISKRQLASKVSVEKKTAASDQNLNRIEEITIYSWSPTFMCKEYYQKHPEIAIKDWEKLVKLRFDAGYVSEVTSNRFKALEILSRTVP